MIKTKITTEIITQGEKQVQESGWKILATSRNKKGQETIKEILKDFDLQDVLYHPNLLLEKDRYKFFVIFSVKEKFVDSKSKKYGERVLSGIDWFKYKLAEHIEVITGIQCGLMMYSKESKELIIRQINQLGKPLPWFKGDGCLLQAIKSHCFKPNDKKQRRLEKVFQDPPITSEEKKIIDDTSEGAVPLPVLKCIECYKDYHPICHRCIKGKHKKIKAMAVWEIGNFERGKLTVQPSLLP